MPKPRKSWYRRLRLIPCMLLLSVLLAIGSFIGAFMFMPDNTQPAFSERVALAEAPTIPAQPEPETNIPPPAAPPSVPRVVPPAVENPPPPIPQIPAPPPINDVPAPAAVNKAELPPLRIYRDADNPDVESLPSIPAPEPVPMVLRDGWPAPALPMAPELNQTAVGELEEEIPPPPPLPPPPQPLARELPPVAGSQASPAQIRKQREEAESLRRCQVALQRLTLQHNMSHAEVQALLVDCQPRPLRR